MKQKNFLTGNLWKQIFLFSLSVIATSMLQQLFNSADTAVVGRFASSKALAAVGSTSMIVSLCITILSGLAVGTNVRVANAIGQGRKDLIKENVDTALVIAIAAGIFVAIVGELTAKPLLSILATPENIIDQAVLYLRIYFAGIPFLMFYNFVASILRASGDSKKPLYCLIIAGILNVGFNLLLVMGFHMGVAGVALGTLIADITNTILATYFLCRGNAYVKLNINKFMPRRNVISGILSIGIPAALQGMMFNMANLIIQSGVNSLGSNFIAATTIGVNANIFVYYLISGYGQAAVTFNGQNYGAGNLKRCNQATLVSLTLGAISTFFLAFAFRIEARPFASIFSNDESVVQFAVSRMKLVLPFELFNMVIEVLSGALRGLGHSTLPMLISAIFVCGTRIVWVYWVFPLEKTYTRLNMVYPTSWILDAVFITIAYTVVLHTLKTRS